MELYEYIYELDSMENPYNRRLHLEAISSVK